MRKKEQEQEVARRESEDAARSRNEGEEAEARQEAEEAVDGIPGVLSVTAVLTAHKQASQQQAGPQQGGPQQGGPQQARTKQEVPGIKHIVAVASGKGGVGKDAAVRQDRIIL